MDSSHALNITQRWVAECNMVMQGSAVAADIDGDGNDEFLTAAYQAVIAVDRSGRELWRFNTDWRFMTCPAVIERPGEPALIYAADMQHNPGVLFCIDGTGTLLWQKDMPQVFWSLPTAADINADGRMEVIQGDSAGGVHAFDALTGDLIWHCTLDGQCGSPAVGDINADGLLETLITTSTGKMYVLSDSGEILRERTLGGVVFDPVGEYASYRICSPVIFHDSTGAVRIVTGNQEPGNRRVLCLDEHLDVLWEHRADGGISTAISVADFNGDGRVDIFAAAQDGRLYRWDEDGRLLWDIDTQGFCYAAGAIVDIDGDGDLEYVLCTELGAVLVFDQSGEIVFEYQLDSRRANRATPAFGRTETGELLFALTGSDTGRMYCFDVPGRADARMEWSAPRCNCAATGEWDGDTAGPLVRMVPENLRWDSVLSTDEISFRVTNRAPGEEPLRAEATLVAPDGTRHGSVGPIVGASGVLKLPMVVTAPGLYRFEWKASNGSDGVVAAGSQDVTLTPFANDQALVHRAVQAVDDALGGSSASGSEGGTKALLRSERDQLATEASELASRQAAVPGADKVFVTAVLEDTASLSAKAARALKLAEIVESASVQGWDGDVLPFSGRMWENRDVDAELPSDMVLPLKIERRCVSGEHEPVSIKLLNVTLDTASVRVSVETGAGGPVVRPHEVRAVQTNPDQNTTAWDPLVWIEAGDVVEIPSFETREVWVDIDLTGVAHGEHRVAVVFQTATSVSRVETVLDVLAFEMAEPDSMRLCMWSGYSEYAVPDLCAHGNSVFVIGVPPATDETDGDDIRVSVDFAELDEFVDRLQGRDAFLLLMGVPQLGVDWEEDPYVPRLAEYLEQVMSHLAEKGIPEDNVALYTWDEVCGHGWDMVRRFVRFGRKALAARPGVKIYVNGGGDLPMFEELAEIAAIWCPAFFMLDDDTPVMDFLRNSGKELWTYNCAYMYARPLGWNTKAMNVVGEFRMQAAFAFRYGATGIGYWCYNVGPNMWEPAHAEYPIVYQTEPGAPITVSRRWEAVRESVEDTRILAALRDRLEAGTAGAATEAIRHLIDVTLPSIADKSLAEMHLGTARYVLDDTNDDAMVESFRQELLDCVAALGA